MRADSPDRYTGSSRLVLAWSAAHSSAFVSRGSLGGAVADVLCALGAPVGDRFLVLIDVIHSTKGFKVPDLEHQVSAASLVISSIGLSAPKLPLTTLFSLLG